MTPFNNTTSAYISQNKYCTNNILRKHNIPVAASVLIHSSDIEKLPLIKHKVSFLKFPLVIKPLDRGLGVGVICNIKTLAELICLLKKFLPVYEQIIVEEFFGNLKSYRVLIFNHKIIGILEITDPFVIGDGIKSIRDLISITNSNRPPPNLFINLGSIEINEECCISLQEQHMTLDSIPSFNQKIILGYSGKGGSYKAIKPKVCKENKMLFRHVAHVCGLNFVGIDVQCYDICVPINKSRGIIVETNHHPNIKMHENPMEGLPNRVSIKMLRSLIYNHPIAYLKILIQNSSTAFYIKFLALFTTIIFLCYYLY